MKTKKNGNGKSRRQRKPAEILGLERLERLTIQACRKRADYLRKQCDRGKFQDSTRNLALRWANWYASKGNQLSNSKSKSKSKRAS